MSSPGKSAPVSLSFTTALSSDFRCPERREEEWRGKGKVQVRRKNEENLFLSLRFLDRAPRAGQTADHRSLQEDLCVAG